MTTRDSFDARISGTQANDPTEPVKVKPILPINENPQFELEERLQWALDNERPMILVPYIFQKRNSSDMIGLDALVELTNVLVEKGYQYRDNTLATGDPGYSGFGMMVFVRVQVSDGKGGSKWT